MVSRTKTQFLCDQCSYTATKWLGKCPQCQAWGSFQEVALAAANKKTITASPAASVQRLTEIAPSAAVRKSTGISELDRVLGGGYVSGSVILLAGEPGIGKSTLLLALAHAIAPYARVLYVTGEESAGQVRLRAERTVCVHENIFLTADNDLDTVLLHAQQLSPHVMIVDSVQTLTASSTEGIIGGTNQVKAITAAVSAFAKATNTTVFIVGHVTKDGLIAGPRTLEHLVDVVLHFEGDKNSTLRMIRGIKNRFGSTDEVGCFEQNDEGIVPIDDPTTLFIHDSKHLVPGSAITVTMDGKRPLVAQVQALIVPTNSPTPRRAVSGLDTSRLAMILAVLERRCKIRIAQADVYAATVGGMKITDPAVDLAIAVAATSAITDTCVQAGMCIMGEVGLAGEVRVVRGIERRLVEAARLGFTAAIVPDREITAQLPPHFTVFPIHHVSEALDIACTGHHRR